MNENSVRAASEWLETAKWFSPQETRSPCRRDRQRGQRVSIGLKRLYEYDWLSEVDQSDTHTVDHTMIYEGKRTIQWQTYNSI